MTVGELLQRMDSRELSEWMAYYQIRSEPSDLSAEPEFIENPEEQAALIKSRLFKES